MVFDTLKLPTLTVYKCMSKYLSTVLTVRDGLRNARHFEQTQYYDNSFRIECTAVYMYHYI